MRDFTSLDLIVLVFYLVGVTVWGAWLGRGQKGGVDYFLGSRSLPWWAVMLSVVATETSTLTFLSVPGVAYMGTMTFLQLTIGYLLGRIVVARPCCCPRTTAASSRRRTTSCRRASGWGRGASRRRSSW